MISNELCSASSSDNVPALLDQLRQTFLTYLRSYTTCSPQGKFPCPLNCTSKGISSLSRMMEHFKYSCPHTKCSQHIRSSIFSIWTDSKKLLTTSSSSSVSVSVSSRFPIHQIIAVSIERPISMLCKLTDESSASGFSFQWIRVTHLNESGAGNHTRTAYRHLKSGKISKVSIHNTQVPTFVPPVETSIFSQSISTFTPSTVPEDHSDSSRTDSEILKYSDLELSSNMSVLSECVSSMILSDSRIIRIKSVLSLFLKWLQRSLQVVPSCVVRMDLFFIENIQRFLQFQLDSEYSVFTKRNICEDVSLILKELNIKLLTRNDSYWANLITRIQVNVVRLCSIWNKKKALQSAEANSIQGLMARHQFLSINALVELKQYVEQKVDLYSRLSSTDISQLSWRKLDKIQSCFLWTLIFRLNPQRSNFFGNMIIGDHFHWSEEYSQYYLRPTASNTKMFFHRRQIRKESLGIHVAIPLQHFLWGCRLALINKTPRVARLHDKEKIPPVLMNCPLFVSKTGTALKDETLLQRIRSIAVRVLGNQVKNISLRSLRQNFQYLFYQSSPSFGELRKFNKAMDHTDSTGLVYYNRCNLSTEIWTPSSILLPSTSSSSCVPSSTIRSSKSVSRSHAGSDQFLAPTITKSVAAPLLGSHRFLAPTKSVVLTGIQSKVDNSQRSIFLD